MSTATTSFDYDEQAMVTREEAEGPQTTVATWPEALRLIRESRSRAITCASTDQADSMIADDTETSISLLRLDATQASARHARLAADSTSDQVLVWHARDVEEAAQGLLDVCTTAAAEGHEVRFESDDATGLRTLLIGGRVVRETSEAEWEVDASSKKVFETSRDACRHVLDGLREVRAKSAS